MKYNPVEKCIDCSRYKTKMPDTLDLAKRLEIGINALTNSWVPSEDWALCFLISFAYKKGSSRLIVNHHTDAFLNIPPKFIEALILCRIATGSESKIDVDRNLIIKQLEFIGEDGLTYCPKEALAKLDDLYKKINRSDNLARPFADVWGEGRMLLALSLLMQIDDNPVWVETAKKKIDGIYSRTKKAKNYLILDRSRFYYKNNYKKAEVMMEPESGYMDGCTWKETFDIIYRTGSIGYGAALVYRLTGYTKAFELCKGFAEWLLDKVFFNEDGSFINQHFHHLIFSLIVVFEYGDIISDPKVLERVDKCYRWAREMGDKSIGFFPEYMPGSDTYLKREGNTAETCEIAGMILLGLKLTQAGSGDYWDDIDRWTRNMLSESQMCDTHIFDSTPEDYFYNIQPEKLPYEYEDDTLQKSVGSFYGWMRANEGTLVENTEKGKKLRNNSIMHCCTANGIKAMFHVWNNIIQKVDGTVKVNLLLNRASKWLDIESWLPVEGKVILKIKNTNKVKIRIPSWCNISGVSVSVNDGKRKLVNEGRYVLITCLKKGDTVEITMPIENKTVFKVIGEMPYKLNIRGSNVTDIEPKGLAIPLFENQPTGGVIEKAMFVPEKDISVW